MAKKSSKNGTIAIASGVRADCSDRLERVIDHMTSEPHIAATNKKKMDEAWEECTTSHPWLRALTAYNNTVFAMLLRMAVDVYNDCLIGSDRCRCDLWLVWRRTICWPLCDKMAQMWNLFHSHLTLQGSELLQADAGRHIRTRESASVSNVQPMHSLQCAD